MTKAMPKRLTRMVPVRLSAEIMRDIAESIAMLQRGHDGAHWTISAWIRAAITSRIHEVRRRKRGSARIDTDDLDAGVLHPCNTDPVGEVSGVCPPADPTSAPVGLASAPLIYASTSKV